MLHESNGMYYKTIKKNEVGRFLDGLLAEYTVVAPVRKNGVVGFDAIQSGEEAILDFSNTTASPKGVLMPQLETLLSARAGEEEAVEHTGMRKPVVLFGARPCDARAFMFLDRVFNDGIARDVYYGNRRDALLIVSLGCTRTRDTCFCTTTGGGPLSTQGSDAMLVEQGDGYTVHVITAGGAELMNSRGLSDAHEGVGEEIRKLALQITAEIDPPVDLSELKTSLDNSFDTAAWQTLTEKCLSCGVCTYLCPTCHCFDIADEDNIGVKVRNRIWDSCQFPGFTMQASGFNPRPTYRERHRQRIMHKFSYCDDNHHMTGCVGCGRCVLECPVNLDIRRVLGSFRGRNGG